MSTSRTRTNSPLQSTRQMLDELDTLMERMLALPVGDVEDLPPLPRDVPITPTVKATLTRPPLADEAGPLTFDEDMPADLDDKAYLDRVDHLLSNTEPLAKPAVPPPAQKKRVDSGTTVARPHFVADAIPEPPPEPPAEEPELPPPAAVIRPAPAVRRPVAKVAKIAVPSPPIELGRWPLLPLLWINQAFDVCSILLGPLGRGLRGERGRNVLGIVGLLCLGLAGAWLVFDQIAAR